MLKTITARLLAIAGIIRFLRWRNRRRILILSLHSVVDTRHMSWQPLRAPFSVDLLEKQLDIISRHYTWLTMDDAVDMLTGKRPVAPNGVVLTFDDGYRNNMSVALPVAEKHGIKPVFYVATGLLNNRKPYWFERLDFAIQQLPEPTQIRIGGRNFQFTPGKREAMRENYAALRTAAKSRFGDDREFYAFFDSVSARLEKASGKALAAIQAGDPCSETLSDEDLKSLTAAGRATIGSHTVDHFRLDTVGEQQCAEQLAASRRYLEDVTGAACRHFCYPNGNWNPQVAEAVAAAGYDSAVTTREGFNSVGDNPYSLRRLHMPPLSDSGRLLMFLSGFGELRSWVGSRIPRR